MTTQEIRDELARMDGWVRLDYKDGFHPCWADALTRLVMRRDHPHPATLDGAAAAMPDGWLWFRCGAFSKVFEWHAVSPDHQTTLTVDDTGSEVHDRYALALAARKAQVTT